VETLLKSTGRNDGQNTDLLIVPPQNFSSAALKNVHVPMKPQRVISATRGWGYVAKDYL